MCQVRQSIAVAVIVLATPYILDRKMIKFLFFIFIASLFHISAICAIPLYFLNFKISKLILIPVVIGSMLFYYQHDLLGNIILVLVPFLPGRLGIIAAAYLKNDLFNKQVEFNTGIYYIARIILVLLFLCFIKIKDKRDYFFINASIFAVVLSQMGNGIMILGRLVAYYQIYAVIAYVYFFKLVSFRKLEKILVIYASCILLFFTIPIIRALTDTKISELSHKPRNHGAIPYYNALYHPWKAQYRKDWNQ